MEPSPAVDVEQLDAILDLMNAQFAVFVAFCFLVVAALGFLSFRRAG